MSVFYFALTNAVVDNLLKTEVATQYPALKLSYSKPGFLTFKGGEEKIPFRPNLARASGVCLGKAYLSDVLRFPKAWAYSLNPEIPVPDALLKLSQKSSFKAGETVRLVVLVSADELWLCEYRLGRNHFGTPGELSPIQAKAVPSRAYFKLAEAHAAFDIDFSPGQKVLELGSAPGGSSLFLLEQGLKVLGVDPGQMDSVILEHKNFRHLRKPFEVLSQEMVGQDIDWIVSDVNLPPTVVLKEIERLLGFLDPSGLIITLKLNQEKHLQSLAGFRKLIRQKGFEAVELKYLPSHRKEIVLIAEHS